MDEEKERQHLHMEKENSIPEKVILYFPLGDLETQNAWIQHLRYRLEASTWKFTLE